MDRRFFIHTLKAFVACSVLADWELAVAKQSLKTPMPLARSVEPTHFTETTHGPADTLKIGVIAVGGIGRSILGDVASQLPCLSRTIAINTDAAALQQVRAHQKIRVGNFSLPSHDPELARFHALSAIPEITDAVAGLDMVLLVAGMVGGAGTGISPVVAHVLREQDILTLGFAISPFDFEGEQRQKTAQLGVRALGSLVHGLTPIRNSDIEAAFDENALFQSVMAQAPLAFIQLCRSIANSVSRPDCITAIDFEDLRHLVLGWPGHCAFGFGSASGAQGALVATDLAINHPFLGLSRLQRASAALVAIEVPPDGLFLREARDIMSQVRLHLPHDSDILYSSVPTQRREGHEFRVSILASGILGT